MEEGQKVCITGITGYLGSWICNKLLEEGKYEVRGTVRDPENDKKMKPLTESMGDAFDDVEVVQVDLLDADSIDRAIEGCTHVIHTASPYPNKNPKNEKDVIEPAENGTKYVLEACKKHKVKRLVFTSSIFAILDYDTFKEESTEADFANADTCIDPYAKSKILAEKAVWDFMEKLPEEEKFDVVTLCPGFIIGPILIKCEFTSQDIVTKIMKSKFPGLPQVYLPVVDVRDVADAHYRALFCDPNERFALVESTIEMVELGK